MESLLKFTVKKIPPPDWTWAVSCVIALVTFYIARYIIILRRYPRGPLPLPILGNLLLLRNNKPLFQLAPVWTKTYGDPVTVWMGPNPIVVVNSWELVKDANIVQRNEFAGRMSTRAGSLQTQNDHDIVFEDFTPTWEALRKVAHTAVRKYAISEELEKLSAEVTEEFVKEFSDGKETDLRTVMFTIINLIIAKSAFGEKLDKNNPDLITIRNVGDHFLEIAPNGLPSDIFPALRILYWRLERKIEKLFLNFREIIARHYDRAKSNYKPGVIRNFTDAVLAARDEAVAEEKNSAVHFTEGNLAQIIQDLFGAGTDTSLNTLGWLFLFIMNEPHLQERMYKEIQDNLGDRSPAHADRKNLPFTMACIYETLRLRPIVPLGLPHKAIRDATIGDQKIPKDTTVLFNIQAVNTDPAYWDEPLKFKPERFLGPDGKFTNERLPSFMPFGIGRRSCLGEKLALADMFYVAVRLLQLRKFELVNGPGSADLDNSKSALFSFPPNHNVILKFRK